MDEVTEADVKRWLTLAQQWRSQQLCDAWPFMEELASFLGKLQNEIVKQANPRTVLQHLPSAGKLLGALGGVPAIQCSGEISQKLVTCILALASHSSELRDDTVTKKAVSWAQSQLRNMTSSSCSDPSILSIGEFVGFTAQETTETFVHKLVESICYDLSRFDSVTWNPEISDLDPVTPLQGSSIRALSEMCVPLISHATAMPLVEALLSCTSKATDVITRYGNSLTADSLSSLFLDQLDKMSLASSSVGPQLSFSAKVNLWRLHQTSFENEILQFVETTVFPISSISTQEIRDRLQSSDLVRACTENDDLRLAAEQLLCSLWRRTDGNKLVGEIVEAFAELCKTGEN